MATFSHPFMNNPEEIDIPAEHVKDVEEIYEWIHAQPRYPNFTKNHAHLFLHACYWDQKAAKVALEKYVTVRAAAPDLFDNRDPTLPGIQQVLDMCQMISMPKKTEEGYTILVYRMIDTDPSKVVFIECIKGFSMFNDVRLSEDLLAEGYVVIFDMKGVRLGHVTRVQLGPLRAFMTYIQEAHPARLKKIYICHAASFVNQIMSMVKPLIKSEMMQLLHFTTKGPQSLFSKELMPIEYGGECGSCVQLYKEQRQKMETIYREWLMDSAKYKEKPKELKSNSNNNNNNEKIAAKKSYAPPIQSFSALEID